MDDGPDAPTDLEHVAVNANWDARVPLHAVSAGYGLDRCRSDPAHLSDVVTFDRARLGEIAGLEVVHLQCHLGTDTLSLHRLGARVTGLAPTNGRTSTIRACWRRPERSSSTTDSARS